MKNQEMFDEIWDRVVNQNIGPSIDKNRNLCVYRHPDGNKCFAGVFIPDDVYRPSMEGKTIGNIVDEFSLWSVFEDLAFIRRLQAIHDTALTPRFQNICKRELTALAKQFNLKIPE